MKIPIKIDLHTILQDPENRAEIIDQLLCMSDFLEPLAELIIYGATPANSYPNYDAIANLRASVLNGFKEYTTEQLVRSEESANNRAQAFANETHDAKRRVKDLEKLIKDAKLSFSPIYNPGDETGPVNEITIKVQHFGNDSCFCSGCKLIRFLSGKGVPE